MTSLLLVLSKDPYTTETPDLVLDIGQNAKEKGNAVALYLVEDGVTAARNGEFGKKLSLDELTDKILEADVNLVF